MAQPLPRLRMDLDFMPSPVEDRPGLLIRDSFGYSDAMLIIPPPLVECLECFNGEATELDLRAALVRITGDLEVGAIQEHLVATLSGAGFLHDEIYFGLREERQREFVASAIRAPSHAGTGYPAEPEEARRTLAEYMKDGATAPEDDRLIAVAAPHVSPFGGWQTYRAAYSALGDAHRERVFVILGTSHYGEPDRFGLTRKPFHTPLGVANPELRLIDELAGEPAANMEDYCHAVEHSIEFQVLFLQYLYGPDIRVLPILCGSYARSICGGGLPEDNENVRRFLGRLGEIAARESDRLMWVLGIDMAHMGMRYGDPFSARTGDELLEQRDRRRIERVNAGDAAGFWDLVKENQDDLKWCGSSPLYTFMKAVPEARGTLRGYEQWNIDERSVVSFGAMAFRRE
jgi:AmmeMemoRadiSam system protein B